MTSIKNTPQLNTPQVGRLDSEARDHRGVRGQYAVAWVELAFSSSIEQRPLRDNSRDIAIAIDLFSGNGRELGDSHARVRDTTVTPM